MAKSTARCVCAALSHIRAFWSLQLSSALTATAKCQTLSAVSGELCCNHQSSPVHANQTQSIVYRRLHLTYTQACHILYAVDPYINLCDAGTSLTDGTHKHLTKRPEHQSSEPPETPPSNPPPSKPNQPPLNLLRQTDIPARNLPNKLRRRIKQHDMKVLDGMHALQRSPIPEPNHILLAAHVAERPFYKSVQLGAGFWEQVVGDGVRGRGEFGPDDEVHDARVDAVGPVVEQDFVVVFWQVSAQGIQAYGSGGSSQNVKTPQPSNSLTHTRTETNREQENTYHHTQTSPLQPSNPSTPASRPAQTASRSRTPAPASRCTGGTASTRWALV